MDKIVEIAYLEERVRGNQSILRYHKLDLPTKKMLQNEIKKWKMKQSKLKAEVNRGGKVRIR